MKNLPQALAAGGFHTYNNELALLNAFLLKARCITKEEANPCSVVTCKQSLRGLT